MASAILFLTNQLTDMFYVSYKRLLHAKSKQNMHKHVHTALYVLIKKYPECLMYPTYVVF